MYLRLADKPIAWIDTETTGLSARENEILEIAIVFDRERAPQHPSLVLTDDHAYYHTKVKPQRLETAHPKALEVNGYAAHPEQWDLAPTFDAVSNVVSSLLRDTVPCGHNVKFDTEFIQEALNRAGNKSRIDYHALDTCVLAYEHLVPSGLEKLSLDTIRDFLGWSKDNAHTALVDALDARRLYKLLTGDSLVLTHEVWRKRASDEVQETPPPA